MWCEEDEAWNASNSNIWLLFCAWLLTPICFFSNQSKRKPLHCIQSGNQKKTMLFCWSLSNTIQKINPKHTELNVNSDHQLSTFPSHHVFLEKGTWSQCLPGTLHLLILCQGIPNVYILRSPDFDLPTFQTISQTWIHSHQKMASHEGFKVNQKPKKTQQTHTHRESTIYPINHAKTNQQKRQILSFSESPSRSFWFFPTRSLTSTNCPLGLPKPGQMGCRLPTSRLWN